MAKRYYDLPSMHALVCFEAAARNQSFKVAAQELYVTPAAISHQVKNLEADLGKSLFFRNHRGVVITEDGAQLLTALQEGFEGIANCITSLRNQPEKAAITINVSPAVSSLWLTPKLTGFWRAYPSITVAQVVSDLEVPKSQWDLCIKYGDIRRESIESYPLSDDTIMALGTPEFAQRYEIHSLEDLSHAPLIQLQSEETGWTKWQEWFDRLGRYSLPRNGFTVNNYVVALQAALDGIGAVLGWKALTSQLIEEGKLVRLVHEEIESPYDLYIRVNPRASQASRVFCDWLVNTSPFIQTE